MTTVRIVCDYLKSIAPLILAEDWDNVGLLLGDDASQINRALTCLTLTSDVAQEAVQKGAGLIVTHHPVLFKPIKKITFENAEGRMLLTLLRHGIAVYSPHTAWDNSASGINQQLAELLELQQIKPLREHATAEHAKLVTFVPESHLDQVRHALWNAGAGVIGNYHNCSFNSRGTGTFHGSIGTNPAIGESGRLEHVEEIRLEVVCTAKLVDRALTALRQAHPYEVPAVDVFSMKALKEGVGSGRMGTLPQPMTLGDLNQLVADRLKQPQIQFVGDANQQIATLGIACGAAAEYLRDAHRAGCQGLLTGEARFHACLEAKELGLGMILPGHYATERFAMETLADRLRQQFSELVVAASDQERDPIQYLPSLAEQYRPA